jgi:protein translocase SecG subunit
MDILGIIDLIVAVLLIVSVLMQSRGTSVGIAFGGGGESFRSKKGIEKFLFYATIILGALFAAISILKLVIA